MTTTDTPRTDACPHCMAKPMRAYLIAGKEVTQHICGSWSDSTREELTDLCLIRERAEKAEAEVEFWKSKAYEAEFHEGKHEAEVERLRSTMRSFIDFMDENLGTTADWPMEAAFDDEETCQKHCDLLNAMKRIVKPEDIN